MLEEVGLATSRLAAVVGFVALQGMVVLLREAAIAFQGHEIAYALGAGAWLLGALLGLAHRERRQGRLGGGGALLALGWGVVPLLVVARGLPLVLRGGEGSGPDLPRLLAGLAVVIGPQGFLAGAAWRRLTTVPRTATARTWADVCGGAAIGGVGATLAPALGVGGLAAAFAGALVASAGATVGALATTSTRRGVAIGCVVVALAGLVVAPRLETSLTRWAHPDLLATAETGQGRITLEKRREGLAVYVDGALAYEDQGTMAEEFAAIAAVQRATPGDVLVLGGGFEGLAREIVPYGPRRVDALEVDDTPLRLAAGVVTARGPRTEVVVADPRRFLGEARRFDLIVSALPEPATARANRHDTVEFFTQCATALGDSGVLATRLRTAANIWTPRQAHRAAAVHAALTAVFADVVVLPGTETVFLASAAPLTRDVEVLVARLERAAPDTRIVSGGWLAWRYTNERAAELVRLLQQATVPANRDRRPACYADAIMLDLAHVLPGIGWHSPPAAGRWLWFALAVLLPPAVFARRRATASRRALAGYAGLAGTSLAIVLMLHDQTVRAVLYRDLGALLAAGVAGLAIGAGAGERDRRHPAQRWRRSVLAVGSSFWSCVIAVALLSGASGLLVTVMGLLGTGVLTGLLLVAVVADVGDDACTVLGVAWGGGCAGSLLTALFLVPFAGLPAACLAIAVLAFPAAIAVWPSAPGPAA